MGRSLITKAYHEIPIDHLQAPPYELCTLVRGTSSPPSPPSRICSSHPNPKRPSLIRLIGPSKRSKSCWPPDIITAQYLLSTVCPQPEAHDTVLGPWCQYAMTDVHRKPTPNHFLDIISLASSPLCPSSATILRTRHSASGYCFGCHLQT